LIIDIFIFFIPWPQNGDPGGGGRVLCCKVRIRVRIGVDKSKKRHGKGERVLSRCTFYICIPLLSNVGVSSRDVFAIFFGENDTLSWGTVGFWDDKFAFLCAKYFSFAG
jgi:hypothetical protein